jgi:tetratricopeptide (TPR) repeat protein
MNNVVIRICDRTIATGLMALALLIPAAVWLPGYTLLQIKTTLLQCGSAILFAAWAVRSLELGSAGMTKPVGRFIAPAFVFALSALASFLFVTSSRDTSLEELGVRIPYFLLFFVTALSCADQRLVRGVLAALMTSAAAVSMYGMLQHFGLDPFALGDALRIQSTFGNPNFYVGFLTLAIPVIVASFDLADARERRRIVPLLGIILVFGLVYYICCVHAVPLAVRTAVFGVFLCAVVALCAVWRLRERSVAAITLFLLVNNMFLTGSRSALIGLGCALIVFLILFFVFVLRGLSWRKTVLLVTASLLLAGAVTGGVISITRSDEGRLNVVSERKYYVQAALELARQRPLMGHGIGTFKNNYPIVKPIASWAYNATCFEFVSNVYNEHLEILHDEGVVGILIWAWLLAAIGAQAILAIRSLAGSRPPPEPDGKTGPFPLRFYAPSPQMLLIGLFSGLAAILIGNIFSLSMRYTATGFLFWLFCGLIAAQASLALRRSHATATAGDRQRSTPPQRKTGLPVRTVQALAVLLAAAGIVFSCRLFLADVFVNDAVCCSKDAYVPVDTSGRVFHDTFIEGTRYKSNPELWERAIRYYHKALDYNPFSLRVRYFFGNAFNRRWNMKPQCNPAWGDRDNIPRTDADRALEQYSHLIKQAPHTFEIDYELGDLYGKLGDLDRSIACYNDYKRYKPFFTKIHHALAEAYMAKKDWVNAAEALKDALDLNQRFTQGYVQLSAVYQKLGKDDLGAEMLAKAREISPKMADKALADVWMSLGEKELADKAYRTAIARNPSDAGAYNSLGWQYIQKKEYDGAIAAYEKVVALDPKNTLAFINLSNLYYETGQMEKAKETYRKAYELDPALVDSYVKGQANVDGR